MNFAPSYLRKLFAVLKACGIKGTDIAQRLGVSNTLVTLWRQGQREITLPHHEALLTYALEACTAWMQAPHPPQTSLERKRIKDLSLDMLHEHFKIALETGEIITKANQDIARYLSRPMTTWAPEDYAAIAQASQLIQHHIRRAEILANVIFPGESLRQEALIDTLAQAQKDNTDASPYDSRDAPGELHPGA